MAMARTILDVLIAISVAVVPARAARAGIEPRIRDAMCGHAPKVVGDEYETPETTDLIEAMRKFPRYEIVPTKGA